MNPFKFFFLAILPFLFMSCGGTTVKVRQSSDGVNAQISVTTNNPTNVQVTPSIDVKLDDLFPLIDSVSADVGKPLSFNDQGELFITFKDDDLCVLNEQQTKTGQYYIESSYISSLSERVRNFLPMYF